MYIYIYIYVTKSIHVGLYLKIHLNICIYTYVNVDAYIHIYIYRQFLGRPGSCESAFVFFVHDMNAESPWEESTKSIEVHSLNERLLHSTTTYIYGNIPISKQSCMFSKECPSILPICLVLQFLIGPGRFMTKAKIPEDVLSSSKCLWLSST